MCRLLQTSDSANPLSEIQATSTSLSYTSQLECVYKIWNYKRWNLQPIFVTGFIDPVENTGILVTDGDTYHYKNKDFLQQNKDIEIEDKYSIN